MNILPRNQAELLRFLHTHGPVWFAHASELGLSPAQAQRVIDSAAEARLRLDEASAARSAAISMTAAAEVALRDAHTAAANAIRIIKNTATLNGDPAVYGTAQIEPPRTARPGSMAPPGRPRNLRVTLAADGRAVTIHWSCTQPINARGTVYIVRRQLPGEAEFSTIATTGRKSFIDRTLPASALAAGTTFYTIQSQRGEATGPESAVLAVRIGQDGGQGKVADGENAGTNKIRLVA